MAYISPYSYVSGQLNVPLLQPDFKAAEQIIQKKQKEYEDSYRAVSALRNVGLFTTALNKNVQGKIDKYNNTTNSYFNHQGTIDYNDPKFIENISKNINAMMQDEEVINDFKTQKYLLNNDSLIEQSKKDKNYNPQSAYLHQLQKDEYINSNDPLNFKLNSYVPSFDYSKIFNDCAKNIDWDSYTGFENMSDKGETNYALYEHTKKYKSFDKFYNCAEASLPPEALASLRETARYNLKTKYVTDIDKKNIVKNYNDNINLEVKILNSKAVKLKEKIEKLKLVANNEFQKAELLEHEQNLEKINQTIPLYQNQLQNENENLTEDTYLNLLTRLEKNNRLTSFATGLAATQEMTKIIPNLVRKQQIEEEKIKFDNNFKLEQLKLKEREIANKSNNSNNSNNSDIITPDTNSLSVSEKLNIKEVEIDLTKQINSKLDGNTIVSKELLQKIKNSDHNGKLKLINESLNSSTIPEIEKQELKKIKLLIETHDNIWNLQKENENLFIEDFKKNKLSKIEKQYGSKITPEIKEKILNSKNIEELTSALKYIFTDEELLNQRLDLGISKKLSNFHKKSSTQFFSDLKQTILTVPWLTEKLVRSLYDIAQLAGGIGYVALLTAAGKSSDDIYKFMNKYENNFQEETFFGNLINEIGVKSEKELEQIISKAKEEDLKSTLYTSTLSDFANHSNLEFDYSKYNIENRKTIVNNNVESKNEIGAILSSIQRENVEQKLIVSNVSQIDITTDKETGQTKYNIILFPDQKFKDGYDPSILFKDNFIKVSNNANNFVVTTKGYENKDTDLIRKSEQIIINQRGTLGSSVNPLTYEKPIKIRKPDNTIEERNINYYIVKSGDYYTTFYKTNLETEYKEAQPVNSFFSAKEIVKNIYNQLIK